MARIVVWPLPILLTLDIQTNHTAIAMNLSFISLLAVTCYVVRGCSRLRAGRFRAAPKIKPFHVSDERRSAALKRDV